ncbi:ParA family protein [Paenibacillus illinoisensis]|uniref:ParA family protein n=1 Tax=Paenibacillus illinoisensis TaxID=59845 RepID=UPI000FD87F84|nr:ParA family protein [Paenibacillus illinoisensis]
MSNILFWSPFAGSGSTSSAVISAYAMALQYRTRVLLVNTGPVGSGIEAPLPSMELGQADSLFRFEEGGWDAVERLHISGSLGKHNLKDYAKPLLRDRLDLLTGRINQMERTPKEHIETLKALLEVANEYYDMVLLDVDREGMDATVLLAQADYVVVNLTQNMRDLELFFEHIKPDNLSNQNMHVVINKYDPQARATLNNIRRRFRYKGSISIVPYTTAFLDAVNRRDTATYLQLEGLSDSRDLRKGSMAASMAELARLIMDGAGMRTVLKRLERGA